MTHLQKLQGIKRDLLEEKQALMNRVPLDPDIAAYIHKRLYRMNGLLQIVQEGIEEETPPHLIEGKTCKCHD